MKVDERRVRVLNDVPCGDGPVVYWMQRDQRVDDNWALLYACERARERQVRVVVVFNLAPQFGGATLRHYDFMHRGLNEVEMMLSRLNIQFVLLCGEPKDTIPPFVEREAVGELVTDFNPLRQTTVWKEDVAARISVRMVEVDAHNIVPCFVASTKQEFAAYTFRPKLLKQLSHFLTPFPSLLPQKAISQSPQVKWDEVSHTADPSVPPVSWREPGSKAAQRALQSFVNERLQRYSEDRNDPTKDGQSGLSPYLHFGQLSAQRVALVVKGADAPKAAKDAFLEELIVRRELADNFCFYNAKYDRVEGAHEWAQKTLALHANDRREHVYTLEQFERALTHDPLWNAMQQQMVHEGKMHGWCRMYWAKKILEWSPDPQTAVDIALYLNDRYELDGRDPNGVVGVMWSICGVHDRAWTERPIFGKVRYMNFAGAKRKFAVQEYIEKYGNDTKLFV